MIGSAWIPAAVAAQATPTETIWRLEADWPWPPWLSVLLVAAAIVLVAYCYRAETSPAGSAYRAGLAVLRGVAIALMLVMLSGLVWFGEETGRPRLAVLLDASDSMQRRDTPGSGATPPSRLEAARQWLVTGDDPVLPRLARDYEIDFYRFGADWRREDNADSPESVAEVIDGASTRLGDAAVAAIETAGPTLRAVLAITDGQVTAGSSLAEAADTARRLGAPLYLVGVGSDAAAASLSLSALRADDRVYLDDLVRFQATLNTRGLAGKTVRLELRRAKGIESEAGDGAVVQQRSVTIGEGSQPIPISFIDRPGGDGEYRYRLVATAPGDGLADDSAGGAELLSELAHTLRVTDDPIRVLLAAGYPNYEFRFLKHLLERDQSIRVATVLQEADPRYVDSDLTALPRFPTRQAELAEYDAVVLIDLDATVMPRSAWSTLAGFVGDDGGGLCLVAGPRGMPASLGQREAFAALCPTRLSSAASGGWSEPAGLRFRPTSLAERDPAFLLSDDPTENSAIWRGLPPIYWRADIGEPKPAASVLAVADGAAGSPPLVVSQFYGAGRVVLHATDSTYRWRRRVGDVFFARYWGQLLRTLARGKRDADAADLVLAASQREYDAGEPVVLTVRKASKSAEDIVEPQLVVTDARGREFRPRVESTADGYRTTLDRLPAGRYRAGLVLPDGRQASSAVFEVVALAGEAARPEMNRGGLRQAAERSRGAFAVLSDANDLVARLPAPTAASLQSLPPIDLWNRWPLLALIVGCLCAEWILRKRKAML
ncbi:MAG: hypothetical protein AAFV43_05945 [Planctomycetota bacterium]